MQISFRVLGFRESPSTKFKEVIQLSPGTWDDYSFKTSFSVSLYDVQGKLIDLGSIKIGYKGQSSGWTKEKLPENFYSLPDSWFSLGQDVEYYKNIFDRLAPDFRTAFLLALRDVVDDDSILLAARDERVFKDSLMRGVSLSAIQGQFLRVLNGDVVRTNFHFSYKQDGDEDNAAVNLDFKVMEDSKPSTNVHVLIGRNGVGKTTLLNNMVRALLGISLPDQPGYKFFERGVFDDLTPLSSEYFSSVVSVSFSAFAPFLPPNDRIDRSLGLAYFYIGMKNARAGQSVDKKPPPKTDADLVNDFVNSFRSCLSQSAKRKRWLKAIKRLESDTNFQDMDLGRLLDLEDGDAVKRAGTMASRMSSGHSIVLLSITKLVDTVEEKNTCSARRA